jgi:putative multiple sugar transport system substrate-binding protein
MKKIKKLFALALSCLCLIALSGCGSEEQASKKLIGVSMPNTVATRWIQDGANIKQNLLAMGYDVDLQYAEDIPEKQDEQIRQMIANGAECLVITPINSEAIKSAMKEAKEKKIPVIAYDRLISGTDNVLCYVTFDSHKIGMEIGSYVEQRLQLKDGKGPYNVEFLAGSPDDNNAKLLNDGVLAVLQRYIDSGQIVVPSGRVKFEDVAITRWLQKSAQERLTDTLQNVYAPRGLHIDAVISEFDGLSYGAGDALLSSGYALGSDWPIITGQDGELRAARDITFNKQSMTMFKDTRLLAEKCAKMVQDATSHKKPDLTGGAVYQNGVTDVPAEHCEAVLVDA